MIVNLREALARGLKCSPGKSREELCDGGDSHCVPGLYIEVTSASPGQGTYRLRYKDVGGTTRHAKIGRSGDIELTDARKRAKQLRAEIALGGDPAAETKAKRDVITVKQLFEDHVFPHTSSRKRSHARDLEMFNLRINKAFGSKRLTDVSRKDVQRFHTELLEDGLAPATCDHYVKLLRSAFNHAVRWELMPSNLLSGIKLFNPDNRIENIPDQAQLEVLMSVLSTDPNRAICRIVLYLMATGCRLSEALNAKWIDVSKENRLWRIPAANSKSKRVRSIPLNQNAMDVINELDTESEFEYVFVNRATGKPYTTIMKVWERLRAKAGLTLRVHDLRHFHASRLVQNNIPIYTVKTLLGHSNIKTTERYAHLNNETLAKASNSLDAILNGAKCRNSDVQNDSREVQQTVQSEPAAA